MFSSGMSISTEYAPLPLLTAVFGLSFTWLVLYFWTKNRNLPPGPWGLPYFGYYPFLSNKPYLDFAKLAEHYGDIFSFRTVGGKLIVVLNGVKTIKDILINRSEEFIGRPLESNVMEWISDGIGVTQEEGLPWKEHRRFFLQTVKNFGFGKQEIEESIHEEMKPLLEDLRKTKGQSTKLHFHIAYAVSSVVSQILFNRKFQKYGRVFSKITEGTRGIATIFIGKRHYLFGSFYKYVVMKLFPSTADCRRGKQALKEAVGEIVDDHVKNFDPNHLKDYVDVYLDQMNKLKKRGELDKSSFTRERLIAMAMNMTMEGLESVTSAILCLLNELIKHPAEQKSAQEELDAVIGRERLPSWLDRQKLPYLDALTQELYRHAMPFFMSTHYSNFEETTIQGYRIPRRTILDANLWTINNDPVNFPNPEKFDVNRFLDKNGKRIKTEGPYPFGIGKRACIGESLAQMEVFIVIATILQNFTLSAGDTENTQKATER